MTQRQRALSRAEQETEFPCLHISHRYLLAVMAALAAIISVGTRAAFALVMTHVTDSAQAASTNLIFSKCTALNATVGISGDVVFLLHTAYYVSFAFTMVPGSMLATLYSTSRVAGVSLLVFSIATLGLPYAIPVSVPLIFLMRIIHGAMEGAKQPALMTMIAAWSTSAEKATLYGIMATGIYTAPALASVMTAGTLCFVSWDSILFIYGCAGVVWSSFWFHGFYDTPELHPDLSSEEAQYLRQHGARVKTSSFEVFLSVPWRAMLTSRAVWAVFLGSFSRNVVFAILVMLQPQYFLDAFHIHAEDMGVLSVVPYVGLGLASMAGGCVSDRLLATGMDKTTVRRIVYSLAYTIEGACLISLYFVSDWRQAFTISCSGIAVGGMAVAAYAPLPSDMAPQYTGILSGLAMTGTLGAVLSTALATAVPGTSKTLSSWQTVYLVAGLVHLASALLFVLMVDATLQPWAKGKVTRSPTLDANNSALLHASDDDVDFSDVTPLTESCEASNHCPVSSHAKVHKTVGKVTYEKVP